MGKTEDYYKKREKELQEHHCAYRDMYTYGATQRDRMSRQLEACDAGKKKMAQTICPYFREGKPFELPPPNGRCAAADMEICRMKCAKSQWKIVDDRLVKA